MPHNPTGGRVIATGGAPPDINQQLLALGAQGFGAGLGGQIGQRMADRRFQRQANPLLEALQGLQPGQDPQQVLAQTAIQDPRLLSVLQSSRGQQLVETAGLLGASPKEASSVDRVIGGDTELGKELGLLPGERARVRFSRDAQGNVISRSVVANPFSDDDDDDEDSGPFGASVRGRSLSFVANLAPGFAENRLTPDQERLFLTSVSNLTQIDQFTDPDTQLLVTRRPELPRFAQQALAARGFSVGEQGIVPPLQAPPNPADVAAFQADSTQAAELGTPQDAVVGSRPAELPTLFEMAARGDVNNPITHVQRFLTRFGLEAQAEMTAKTAAVTLKERVVKALQQSPRYAEGEAERIGEGFQFDPEVLAMNSRYMQRAIAADDVLARIQQENFEVITGKRAMVPGETREHAMATLNAITNARSWLIPPRVESVQQLDEFFRTSVPGTIFLVPGEREGTWDLYEVPGQQ